MIVKDIRRDADGSKASKALSINALVQYILNPGAEEHRAMRHELGHSHKIKCSYAGARNFYATGNEGRIEEMTALACRAVKSKQPISHYMLSWREGEIPTVEQIEEAVTIYLEELGLQNCQVLYGYHEDTRNRHLHLAVNRLDPDTLEMVQINDGWTRIALQRAVCRIEHAQGWKPVENALFEIVDGEPVQKTRTRDLRLQPSQRQQDMENRTGTKSAVRVGIEEAGPIISAAQTWDQVHLELAKIRMRYEPAKSGAVIFVGDIPVRASSASKDASFLRLQKRLGPFEAAAEKERTAPREAEPLDEAQAAAGWSDYEKARRKYQEARKAAELAVNQKIEADRTEVATRYREEREELHSYSWTGRGVQLNAFRSVLADREKKETEAMKPRHVAWRKELSAAFPRFPDFAGWLMEQGKPELAEAWRNRATIPFGQAVAEEQERVAATQAAAEQAAADQVAAEAAERSAAAQAAQEAAERAAAEQAARAAAQAAQEAAAAEQAAAEQAEQATTEQAVLAARESKDGVKGLHAYKQQPPSLSPTAQALEVLGDGYRAKAVNGAVLFIEKATDRLALIQLEDYVRTTRDWTAEDVANVVRICLSQHNQMTLTGSADFMRAALQQAQALGVLEHVRVRKAFALEFAPTPWEQPPVEDFPPAELLKRLKARAEKSPERELTIADLDDELSKLTQLELKELQEALKLTPEQRQRMADSLRALIERLLAILTRILTLNMVRPVTAAEHGQALRILSMHTERQLQIKRDEATAKALYVDLVEVSEARELVAPPNPIIARTIASLVGERARTRPQTPSIEPDFFSRQWKGVTLHVQAEANQLEFLLDRNSVRMKRGHSQAAIGAAVTVALSQFELISLTGPASFQRQVLAELSARGELHRAKIPLEFRREFPAAPLPNARLAVTLPTDAGDPPKPVPQPETPIAASRPPPEPALVEPLPNLRGLGRDSGVRKAAEIRNAITSGLPGHHVYQLRGVGWYKDDPLPNNIYQQLVELETFLEANSNSPSGKPLESRLRDLAQHELNQRGKTELGRKKLAEAYAKLTPSVDQPAVDELPPAEGDDTPERPPSHRYRPPV